MRERNHEMVTDDEVYPYLPEGFLLDETDNSDPFGYWIRWRRSRAESFEPFDIV
jgi:hypothetical protein